MILRLDNIQHLTEKYDVSFRFDKYGMTLEWYGNSTQGSNGLFKFSRHFDYYLLDDLPLDIGDVVESFLKERDAQFSKMVNKEKHFESIGGQVE